MRHMQIRSRRPPPATARSCGFTLIELLVVISIVAIVIAILIPALSSARQSSIGQVCLANLRTLGQGLTMYSTDHHDHLVPGRLPRVDNDNWRALVLGGWKYRPTFLAMMGTNVGIQAFDDPMPSRFLIDRFGERGDKQNYSSKVYVCPAASEWTDERNGSYGYNYQFLGNSRLSDSSNLFSFKYWPVSVTRIRDTSRTVAVADSMGTAATYGSSNRWPYQNNAEDGHRFGNEGFNLDPPHINTSNGEAAGYPDKRTAVDPRHLGKAATLWVDTHASVERPEALGYHISPDGAFRFDGNNALWSGTGQDVPWTPDFSH
ncbi:MAG: hypothetical protein DCC65_00065 [Planctomycetota bacterium]|nr:MAG: hypothetical protein DCC65_00065 [Planctomycetota bacterium]